MDSMYHLRRVNYQRFIENNADMFVINDKIAPSVDPTIQARSTLILLDGSTKFGRNPDVVDIQLECSQQTYMMSRVHAKIEAEVDSNTGNYVSYSIEDKSLNGTYVNDTRVDGKTVLNNGDLITFGHLNGAAIGPGQFSPQPMSDTECVLQFRFEPAISGHRYFGYDNKRVRLNVAPRLSTMNAYMKIISNQIEPIELTVFDSAFPSNPFRTSISSKMDENSFNDNSAAVKSTESNHGRKNKYEMEKYDENEEKRNNTRMGNSPLDKDLSKMSIDPIDQPIDTQSEVISTENLATSTGSVCFDDDADWVLV